MKLRSEQIDHHLKDHRKDIVVISKGGGFATIGRSCGLCFNFIIRLILTRTLSLESVGLYFLGMNVIQFSMAFSLLGFESGMLKFVSIAHGKNELNQIKGYVNTAFKFVIPSTFIVSLSLFLLSDQISVRLFHNPEFSKLLQLLAITTPFTVVMMICVFTTQSFKQIQYKVFVKDIFGPVVNLVSLVFFVFLGYQLMGALAAYIISVVSSFFLGLYFLNKKLPFSTKGKITRSQTVDLLRFSLTQTFSRLLNVLMNRMNVFMIGYFLTIGNVGIYSVAFRLTEMCSLFLYSFIQIFNPLVSDLANKEDFKRIERNYQTVTKLVVILSLPVCLVMISFPHETLMVFGVNYINGVNCLVILAIGQLVNSATGFVSVILNMSGKHVLNLYNSIGMLTLNIMLNIFLIPRYGISGAAIASLISMVLFNLIRLIQVYFIFGIQPYNLSYLKPLFVGTFLIAIFSVIKQVFAIELNLPIFIIVVAGYFGLYFLFLKFVGFTEEETLILDKIKAKFIPAN